MKPEKEKYANIINDTYWHSIELLKKQKSLEEHIEKQNKIIESLKSIFIKQTCDRRNMYHYLNELEKEFADLKKRLISSNYKSWEALNIETNSIFLKEYYEN